MKKALFYIILMTGAASFSFAQKPQMGGASTGEAKTYTTRRTTGIVDEKARKVYEDVTTNTALVNFQCVSGGKEKNYIVETTACTVAVFDDDEDGKPDIVL